MMAPLVSAGLEIAEIAAILALCRSFYRDGFERGYKSGYKCGRTDSEKWFVQQGAKLGLRFTVEREPGEEIDTRHH